MRRKIKVIAILLIICFVGSVANGVTQASATSFEEKIQQSQEKKKELEQLKKEAQERKAAYEKRQKETEETLANLSKEIDDITKYIQKLDEELMVVMEHLNTLEQTIADKEQNLVLVKEQLAEAEATEAEQYETMKKRIRYLYENGNESFWSLLVGAEGLSDLLNRAEYRSRITAYDNTLLERYELAKQMTQMNQSYLETSIEELYSLKEQAEFERDTYLDLSAEKGAQIEQYLAKYQISEELLEEYGQQIENEEIAIGDIYEQEEKRAVEEAKIRAEEEERIRKAEEERRRREEEERRQKEIEEERARLEASMREERLNAATGIQMTLETSVSKMIWPLPGDGRIYSKFGPRKAPLPGASTYHMGVDIGGEFGASIVASLAGTVSSAAYNSSGGNTVIIDHGNGVQTKYLHCSKMLVKKGDFVMQGEVIALVGSTGISTGPHLHFGVVFNGTHVDPLKYISYN